jgi:hypothetical protein
MTIDAIRPPEEVARLNQVLRDRGDGRHHRRLAASPEDGAEMLVEITSHTMV